MLETPALGGNVRVAPDEADYVFRDTALESLTPAQKHLARMGAANTRLIQGKLRQIALAIGIRARDSPSSLARLGATPDFSPRTASAGRRTTQSTPARSSTCAPVRQLFVE